MWKEYALFCFHSVILLWTKIGDEIVYDCRCPSEPWLKYFNTWHLTTALPLLPPPPPPTPTFFSCAMLTSSIWSFHSLSILSWGRGWWVDLWSVIKDKHLRWYCKCVFCVRALTECHEEFRFGLCADFYLCHFINVLLIRWGFIYGIIINSYNDHPSLPTWLTTKAHQLNLI